MFRKSDDRHEFKPLLVEIEERPLNPLGLAVFWIIILAILFTGFWMCLGEVDVVVTARGKVISTGEVKTVQPLNVGVVRSILIKPGDYVRKGQILMEIDPSDIDPELESMQADLGQVELEVQRIEALLEGRDFLAESDIYDARVLQVQYEIFASEMARLEKQIQIKVEGLSQLTEQLGAQRQVSQQAEYLQRLSLEKLERLNQVKDLLSRDEFDKAESDANRYDTELKSARHKIEELYSLKAQLTEEIDFIKEENRNRLLSELAEKKQKYLYLQARIEKGDFLSARQQITSPVEGYVAQLLFHTVGGVVTPAEKLAHIVPKDSPLLVKGMVLNQDVGFVGPDMDASIKVDAYNFQKYGLLAGRVLRVSNDSVEDKNLGLVYEIYIAPHKITLLVDGVETPIVAGMSVSAEVKVGKRRIIEFFIYPLIKYLDEGISVR